MAADFEEEGRLANETVTRQSSNPNIGIAAASAFAVAAVLGLMWYSASRARSKPLNAVDESFATAKMQPGMGFNPQPPRPDDNRFVIPPPTPVTPAPPPAPIVVAAQPEAPTVQAAYDDSERLRKEEEAKRQARLRSPMLIVSDKEGTATVDPSARVGLEDKDDDPNRRFLRNAENDVVKALATQNKRIDALVPQGFMIRGVLETAIQSDLPGNVRASTTEDVYSFDGRRVLIPKGTMLTGEYKSGLVRGQTRVFVVWTRMLRADGVSLMVGSYGTDNLGRSGLPGEVDTHFLQRFGGAALLTLAGGASQFAATLGNNQNQYAAPQYAIDPVTGTLAPITGVSQTQLMMNARMIGAQSAAQGINRMAAEALKEDIKIPPTIHVDQGTRIMVFVKRDLDFSDLYPDPVKEALYELRHPGKRARGDKNPAVGDASGVLPASGRADPPLAARY